MTNHQQPQWITDEEIEQAMRANGWNFFSAGDRHWVLPFAGSEQIGGYQVHVENGLAGEGFVGVHIHLVQTHRKLGCLRKALSLMNGHLGIVKFTLQDGHVVARTAFLRLRAVFPPEKLRRTLQHAIGGLIAGAEFARPILECCLRDEGCDPEEAFRNRVTELGLGRPDFGGLAPPPE